MALNTAKNLVNIDKSTQSRKTQLCSSESAFCQNFTNNWRQVQEKNEYKLQEVQPQPIQFWTMHKTLQG